MFIKARIGWQRLTKKEYLDSGEYYLITGTDIDEGSHTVDLSRCYYVSRERYEADANIQMTEGDIIVTKDGTIGKVAILKGLDKPATLNSHLFVLRDLSGTLDTQFLLQVLISPVFQDFVESTKTGSTLTGMPQKTIVEFSFLMPSLQEQKSIASLLGKLDNLITLHQRKHEKLQNIKKSMLEKMFPRDGSNIPEVRFAGFTDPWEQRKWSETVDISTEMVDPTSGEYDDLPHIAPGNIESFTGRILDNVKTVKEEQLISGKFRFRPGDVVYVKINPQLGKYFYASVDGLTSADAYVFNGKNGVTQKFLFSLLQTEDFFKYSVSVSKRSGMPKINRDELNAYSFLAPNEQEQERIGDFLLGIDNLITLHQRRLFQCFYNQLRFIGDHFHPFLGGKTC